MKLLIFFNLIFMIERPTDPFVSPTDGSLYMEQKMTARGVQPLKRPVSLKSLDKSIGLCSRPVCLISREKRGAVTFRLISHSHLPLTMILFSQSEIGYKFLNKLARESSELITSPMKLRF